KEHIVTFYTDVDSISISTANGGVYNFAFLLNGKDTCYTQVVGSPKEITRYKSKSNSGAEIIPFTLDKNNRIYIKGQLNQSDSLNLRVDLGAAFCSINNASAQKARLIADNSANNDAAISSYNQLDISSAHWD